MRREYRPLRLFVEEDGKRYPTILFWLFALAGVAILGACSYMVASNWLEDRSVASQLTRTPTVGPPPTDSPAATEPSAPEPTATEFVYDDPNTWDFVERYDPIQGKTFLDLQDWQKGQKNISKT